ncbi:MAG: substrate-binding domain-containing protein [Saccharospirillaceae bacterium]|nr:ATP-binding protein [Pseudomonadales bacterium]NRB78310.1 substrate-binding domain-containing protein [Saccharospirillaceae bacterium]
MLPSKQINIGLQVVSLSDAYNNALIDCINTVATKLNINLILFLGGTPGNPGLKPEHQQSVIYEYINADNIDAIILLTPTLSNFTSDIQFRNILESVSSVPVVSIGMDISQYISNQSSIIVDSEEGLTCLIEHLIVKQSFTNLAFITGPLKNPEALIRFNIYNQVLKKHNIKIDNKNIYYGNFIAKDAEPALDQFLSKKIRPQVIICSNDICAIAIIEELSNRNIKVPEQIAVTGFDNINESKNCTPSLTTVSQSFIKIGALAIKLAIDHVYNKPCDKLYYSDTIFIKRNSCGYQESKKTKKELEDELNKYVLPFEDNNKTDELEEYEGYFNIYDLLVDIINKIIKYTNNNMNQSIIEFEEHYFPVLEERLKSDIRLKSGYKRWLSAVIKFEDLNSDSSIKSQTINLITIMIREVLEKEVALVKTSDLSTRNNIYFVKGIIEEIAEAKNFDELAERIRSQYQQLSHFIDLKNYTVLGYPTPIKKPKDTAWKSPKTIDMILSFNDIKNKNFKNSTGHDARYLFPKELITDKKRYTMVVETLYSADSQLGRVSYELYPREIDLFSCAMITTQISSTIRIIHQNNERILAQDKIDLLVSDLETKKQMAEEAVIAKSHFLATMSHEIRTPMNGVLGVTELLKDTNLSTVQTNYLEIIQNSANSLLNIISDILDFSKIEEGKLSVEHINFNLKKLCNEVISVFSFNAKKSDINLKLIINKNIPKSIISDPTRLRQILLNLIGNSFKFTEKGSITLCVELVIDHSKLTENKNILKFSVIDTGIGISKENINELFGAFNQADSSITRKFGGSGLGLSISKSLSELLGGDIGVTSNNFSGSTFWFTILSQFDSNFIEFQENTPTQYIKRTDKKELLGKEILIAEDNKVNQLVIKGMIKKTGANVTIVENGQEAFKIYQQSIHRFDLIVMDFEMPVLDGASATRKIRALENLINTDDTTSIRIPIIAITAHAMKEHRDACFLAGMDDFLSKPIDSEKLYGILNKFLYP